MLMSNLYWLIFEIFILPEQSDFLSSIKDLKLAIFIVFYVQQQSLGGAL